MTDYNLRLELQPTLDKKLSRRDTTEDLDNGEGELYDTDNDMLRAQGHAAELERSFSWIGVVGLAFR